MSEPLEMTENSIFPAHFRSLHYCLVFETTGLMADWRRWNARTTIPEQEPNMNLKRDRTVANW